VVRARRPELAGAAPLPPKRKWRAITLATLLLVPAYWAILGGLVSVVSSREGRPPAGPLLAFGLSLLPFVFIVLAFTSEHPRAPGAVLKAMGLALLVGIPVSALAADAITGLVGGVAAGGVAALRREPMQDLKPRVVAVLAATLYAFLLLRIAPEAAVVAGPILPFTSLGLADHISEWRRQRARQQG
jgi:hypothetical protein